MVELKGFCRNTEALFFLTQWLNEKEKIMTFGEAYQICLRKEKEEKDRYEKNEEEYRWCIKQARKLYPENKGDLDALNVCADAETMGVINKDGVLVK